MDGTTILRESRGKIVGYKWDINGITKRGYIISPEYDEYDEKEPAFVVYKKSSERDDLVYKMTPNDWFFSGMVHENC